MAGRLVYRDPALGTDWVTASILHVSIPQSGLQTSHFSHSHDILGKLVVFPPGD